MIKADIYYRAESDQLVIVTPVYVLQEGYKDECGHDIKYYSPIRYAIDNGEILVILNFECLKHFERMGEL